MESDLRSGRERRPGLRLGPAVLGACLIGCGHAPAPHAVLAPGAGESAEVVALREALRSRDERLKELESRLALVEAEQRQFRYAIEDLSRPAPPAPAAEVAPAKRGARAEPKAEPAASERDEPRVVLRLHEDGIRVARTEGDERPRERAALQDVPVVSERLPVAPLPSASALSLGVAPIATAPVRALPQPELLPTAHEDDSYPSALDALAARDFRNAALLFERFMREHPRDPRFAKATYWRAEAMFALHSYAAARSGFETYLGVQPQGDRAPDAWFKLGHARARSGDASGAKAAFRELRTRFPSSAAARMAAEEEP